MTNNLLPISTTSDSNLEGVLNALQAEQTRRQTENRLAYYRPYDRQRDFHEAGATYRERLLMAGNQLGKTLAGGFEVAMAATGRYAPWWKGKRFNRPVVGWACGVTGEVVRDTIQKVSGSFQLSTPYSGVPASNSFIERSRPASR